MGLFIFSRAILLTACGILVFTINYVRSETKDSLNCFSEEDSNCEKNAIKISSEYYGCDMVLNIPNPPKRIGSINANVVVQIGDQTFNLRNDKLLLSSTNIILPPADDFYDYSYNRFYVNRRGAFMRDDRLRKEFEIVTSGSRGIQQLALDLQNRNLFILTMTPRGTNGSVYLVKTDQKESSGGKIKAVKVQELGNDITAIATEERANRVLLGMKTESGGKLIRLKKLDRHPCATTNGGEDLIETIIKEAKEKILKAISEISIQPSKANLVDRSAPADKSLQMENAKLKRELLVANTKLNAITSKMFGFRKNIQPMPQHSLAQVTKRKEQRIQYSQTNYMEIPVPYGGYYPSSGSSRAESPPEQSSNSYFIPSHVITEESNQSSDGEPSQTDESLDTVLDQIFGNPISPCSGYQCPQFIPPPPPEFSMSPTCNCAELVFNNHTQIMEIEKLQKALDDMSASVKSILEGTDVPTDAAADYIDPID